MLALAAAGIWIFVAVADEILEHEAHAMDRAIMLAMRDSTDPAVPAGPGWLKEVARDITALGGVTVLSFTSLAVVGFLLLRRAFAAAILTAVAVLGAQLTSALLKLAFDRPRPALVPAFVEVYTASFPSGHAMASTAVYLTLAIQLARVHRELAIRGYLLAVALTLSAAIGASRVYLGVHWPTDVVAGWAAGGAWALLVMGGARLLRSRTPRARERSPDEPGRGGGEAADTA